MTTVVDRVGVDTLADLDGQRQEAEEGRWNADGDKAGLRAKVSPGRGWSRLGLSGHRDRTSGSSLDWSRVRCTRLAGEELAV